MCYLIAKKFDDVGCVALQTNYGEHPVSFKKRYYSALVIFLVGCVRFRRLDAFQRAVTVRAADAASLLRAERHQSEGIG